MKKTLLFLLANFFGLLFLLATLWLGRDRLLLPQFRTRLLTKFHQDTGLTLNLTKWSLWNKGVPSWNPLALLRESFLEPSLRMEGSLDGLLPESCYVRLSAQFHLLSGRLEVEELLLEGKSFTLRGDGNLALHGRRFLRGRVHLTRLNLRNLPAKLRPIPDLRGFLDGNIALGGTLDAPKPVGTLSLSKGECKLDKIPRIRNLEGTLSLEGNLIRLVSLRGEMGGGHLIATGQLPFPPTSTKMGVPQTPPQTETEILRLVGDQILLHRSPRLRLRSNLDLRVKTQAGGRFLIKGEINLVSSKYAHRHSLLPNLKVSGSPRAGQELRLFSLPEPFGQLIDLDIQVGTQDPFIVRTHLMDTRLGINLNLRGTGFLPRLTGEVNTDGGKIRLPGMAFRLKSGLVRFLPSNPGHPRFLFQAEGRRHSIDVRILAEGSFDDPRLHFGSTPSFPTRDLVVLALTGEIPSSITRLSDRGKLLLLGNYALSEFLGSLTKDDLDSGQSFLDRVSIEVGTEIGPTGLESIIGEYALSKHFSLQVERDIFEDYNMGIVWRVRF
jgi:translocation and assembly module TamB